MIAALALVAVCVAPSEPELSCRDPQQPVLRFGFQLPAAKGRVRPVLRLKRIREITSHWIESWAADHFRTVQTADVPVEVDQVWTCEDWPRDPHCARGFYLPWALAPLATGIFSLVEEKAPIDSDTQILCDDGKTVQVEYSLRTFEKIDPTRLGALNAEGQRRVREAWRLCPSR